LKSALPWLQKKIGQKDLGRGMVALRGKKVVIREKRLSDAADDYAWRVDPELARLDATKPIRMSYDQFLRYTQEELSYDSPSSKRLAIDTLDGRHIGNCMYYDIDLGNGETELGILIGDQDYWSKGYGKEAVDLLLAHIFTTYPIKRVYLHTLEWNNRARRAFAKSRFREVGKVHRSGMDFILMEIHLSEWQLARNEQNNIGATKQETPSHTI